LPLDGLVLSLPHSTTTPRFFPPLFVFYLFLDRALLRKDFLLSPFFDAWPGSRFVDVTQFLAGFFSFPFSFLPFGFNKRVSLDFFVWVGLAPTLLALLAVPRLRFLGEKFFSPFVLPLRHGSFFSLFVPFFLFDFPPCFCLLRSVSFPVLSLWNCSVVSGSLVLFWPEHPLLFGLQNRDYSL